MSTGLPARRAHLSKPWTEVLSASLARAGLRKGTSAPVTVERGWPLAKIPLLLRCSEPDCHERSGLWWSFYFLGSDKVPFTCRSALKNRSATYLDELNAVVQIFPRDLLLSGVDQALTKETALEAVQSALEGEEDDCQSLTAQILNYKPSRRLTVRYRLILGSGRKATVFGKLYPDSSDRASLQIQQAIGETLTTERDDQFSVPQVAGRIPQWRALLWRQAPGRSVFDLLRSSKLEEIMGRVARCLGKLHASDTEWGGIHDGERELSTVRSWLDAVGVASPEGEAEREAVYRRMSQTISKGRGAPLVPSHRDFYDKQILIDDSQCTLLDFEVASRAEAELDVANFLAHLELRSLQGRMDGADSVSDLFVAEYSRVGARLNAARLNWYLASSLLRLACVYSFRSDWAGLTPSLVQASDRALDGEPSLVGERT